MLYVQELIHEDFDQRIEFCELIEVEYAEIILQITMSFLIKLVSNFGMEMLIVKNFRYWSTKNPH